MLLLLFLGELEPQALLFVELDVTLVSEFDPALVLESQFVCRCVEYYHFHQRMMSLLVRRHVRYHN